MCQVQQAASARRYVLISPVRDEAEYLQLTIDSVVSQTVLPVRWVIVDDGSSDGTGALADAAAAEHAWITVLHRRDRGRRSVGPGVVEAFYAGYDSLGDLEYDYLCKLDGDVSFGPRYFERLFELFERDPRLGSASGKVFLPLNGRLVKERMIDDHVAGQVKCHRRRCFEEIGGFVREVMWDAIDGHRARMLGWKARSFPDADLRIIHHRLMGSSQQSIIHGRLRWGRGQYFMGTHPLYVLASGINRMRERPFFVGGLCIIIGYFTSWLRGLPRYDDAEFRRALRTWQLRRLHLGR